MNATTLPRLPRHLLGGGASVAVRLPLGPGSLAHRPVYGQQPTGRPLYGQPTTQRVTLAACAPDDDPCAELTASWADHIGAQACTEPACWPAALTEARPAVNEPAATAAGPPAAPVQDRSEAAMPTSATSRGITAGTPVWISVARHRIAAHRIDGPLTGCGRSTRNGEQLTAIGAWTRHTVQWCDRCWTRKS